jgi:hypothetical protein
MERWLAEQQRYTQQPAMAEYVPEPDPNPGSALEALSAVLTAPSPTPDPEPVIEPTPEPAREPEARGLPASLLAALASYRGREDAEDIESGTTVEDEGMPEVATPEAVEPTVCEVAPDEPEAPIDAEECEAAPLPPAETEEAEESTVATDETDMGPDPEKGEAMTDSVMAVVAYFREHPGASQRKWIDHCVHGTHTMPLHPARSALLEAVERGLLERRGTLRKGGYHTVETQPTLEPEPVPIRPLDIHETIHDSIQAVAPTPTHQGDGGDSRPTAYMRPAAPEPRQNVAYIRPVGA